MLAVKGNEMDSSSKNEILHTALGFAFVLLGSDAVLFISRTSANSNHQADAELIQTAILIPAVLNSKGKKYFVCTSRTYLISRGRLKLCINRKSWTDSTNRRLVLFPKFFS